MAWNTVGFLVMYSQNGLAYFAGSAAPKVKRGGMFWTGASFSFGGTGGGVGDFWTWG